MRSTIYTFSFILYTLIISCNTSKNKDDKVTPAPSASLHIHIVHQVLQSGTLVEVPLKDVSVFLYLNDNDRTNSDHVQKSGVTDDSGKVVFNSLPDSYYYITASHATLGIKKIETATPNGSVSYEDIIY